MIRDGGRKVDAVFGFGILGSNAAPAIPALLRQMEHSYDPQSQIGAITAIGGLAMGPLTEAITNRSNSTGLRVCAIEVLESMHTNAAEVLWVIVSCVNDEDKVSQSAISALASIAPDPEMIAPVLTNALASPRVPLRTAAVQALGSLAERAPSLAPLMRVALTDEDNTVREFATNGLRKFYPEEFPGLQ